MVPRLLEIVLEGISGQIQGLVVDEGAKKLNDARLRNQFEKIGAFIAQYVGQSAQDEFAEKLKLMFSEEEMRGLYEKMKGLSGFVWQAELERRLRELCEGYEIAPKDAEKFTEEFFRMVFFSLAQHDEKKAEQMFLGMAHAEEMEWLEKISRAGDDTNSIVRETYKDVKKLKRMIKNIEAWAAFRPGQNGNLALDSWAGDACGSPEQNRPQSGSGEDVSHSEKGCGESGRDREDPGAANAKIDPDAGVVWEIQHRHHEGLFGGTEERREDMRALTVQWREERMRYPNWFILPEKLRDKVRMYNQCEELLQYEDLLPLAEQFEFAYELLWRYETAMLSYSAFLQHHAYRIWHSVMEEDDWSWEEKNRKWFQIGLSLLREYREELKEKEWAEVFQALRLHADFMDCGAQYLAMEEIAWNFASMNILKTVTLLSSFRCPETCFEIRLRLCGIKAECGFLEEAGEEAESLAEDIRTRIASGACSEQSGRIYLKSILPCVLQLQRFILRTIRPHDEKRQAKAEICGREISEWSAFYSYEEESEACDRAVFEWLEGRRELPLFDLHRETVPIMVSDQFCHGAYSFYRVLEKSGLPLRLGHTSLLGQHQESMMESIIEAHVQVGWQLLLRSGKQKTVERTITRTRLSAWPRAWKDQFFAYVYHALDCNVDMIKEYNPWCDGNIYTSVACSALEILKRMSSVATPLQQDQLLRLMIKLIDKNAIKEFRALDSFIANIMENAGEQSKAAALPALLDCSADERYQLESEGQLDPFEAFSGKEQAKELYSREYVDPAVIENLFRQAENSDTARRSALARLGKLFAWEKLSADQLRRFGALLWERTGETTGLPDLPNYYVHVFLQWPHPQDVDAEAAVRRYFFSGAQKKKLLESVNTRSLREVSFLSQLCALNENVPGFWSGEETERLMSLLLGFWSAARKQADSEGLRFDFEKRMFRDNIRLLIRVIASFSRAEVRMLSPETAGRLRKALESIHAYGIPTYEADVNFLEATGNGGFPEETGSGDFLEETRNGGFLEELADALYESDASVTVSAALAVQKYLKEFPGGKAQEFLFQELLKVIRAGKQPGLLSFLIVVHNIFYVNTEKLPESVLRNVEKALICVEKQTAYSEEDDEATLKKSIEVRCQCAALAFQLYRYEKTWKDGRHSDAALLWLDICCGPEAGDEFAEVRNAWVVLP